MALSLFRRQAGPPDAPPPAKEPLPSWDFSAGTPLAPGRTVLKSLGGGSSYEVHLVWDERLFCVAVAKVLRPHLVADERALRHLRREEELLRRLAHPALVRALGAPVPGGPPHLLLEHVEGPTLHRLLRRHGPLALEQAIPLALHLAAALQYLANEEVVHLDVKPANVVMDLQPRLIDLSIARSCTEAAVLRAPIGTDSYMAPEQCDPGLAPVGPAADVWALGALLHHALAGAPPFPRREGRRFPQLDAPPPPLPGHVPAPFAAVVARMMARRPEERPAPHEVAEALEPLATARRPRPFPARRRG